MLSKLQKTKFKISSFEKTDFKKPSVLAVYNHFYPDNRTKRSGRATIALCPLHGDTKPSFALYEDTQSFYCFSCGEHGDSFELIKKILGVDFREALAFAKEKSLL